eukprot:Gb_04103 [translate_table: standard]
MSIKEGASLVWAGTIVNHGVLSALGGSLALAPAHLGWGVPRVHALGQLDLDPFEDNSKEVAQLKAKKEAKGIVAVKTLVDKQVNSKQGRDMHQIPIQSSNIEAKAK